MRRVYGLNRVVDNGKCPAFKSGSVHKSIYIVSLCLLLLSQIPVLGQPSGQGTWPNCRDYYDITLNRCTSNDVQVSYVYVGDEAGGSLGSCSEGEELEGYIWSGWISTAQNRYFAHGVFNLTIANETITKDFGRLWGCAGDLQKGVLKEVMLYGPFTFYCGDKIYLNLTATAWSNNNDGKTCDCPTYTTTDPDCPTCSYLDHPKCRRLGNITVQPQPPGSISGFKWEDLNKNGTWDIGEPPLSGWNITCYNATKTFSNLTDENGFFIFQNLSDGTYTIIEEVKSGWEQTYPTGGTPSGSHSATIADYKPVTNKNFGNFFNANFTLVKIADHYLLPGDALPGTQINYTIWINNTGKANLTKESVIDLLEGSSYDLPNPTGDTTGPGILNVSEKWRYDFNITVTEKWGDICDGWINNTVIANFTTTHIPYIKKQAWSNVTTDYTADFNITKIAEYDPDPAIPGTQINFTIWINNTGNVNQSEIDVTDSLFNAYLVGNKTGDAQGQGILNVSENWTYTFNFTIPANPDPWYNNTVTANFTDPCNNYINKSAWANVSTTVCQTADAGNDTIVCSGVAALLKGNATGFYEVEWNITAGCNETGLVWPYPVGSDPPHLNATYTPSAGEDHCNLTFTVTGPCANATDNVTVWVVDTPSADIRVIEPSRYAS